MDYDIDEADAFAGPVAEGVEVVTLEEKDSVLAGYLKKIRRYIHTYKEREEKRKREQRKSEYRKGGQIKRGQIKREQRTRKHSKRKHRKREQQK